MIAVKKPSILCLCIGLNSLSKALAHYQMSAIEEMPAIEEILPDLAKAKMFQYSMPKMDIGKGYWIRNAAISPHSGHQQVDTDGSECHLQSNLQQKNISAGSEAGKEDLQGSASYLMTFWCADMETAC